VAARSSVASTAALLNLPTKPDGSPDFAKMTAAQKLALARQKIKSDLARATQ
jgi:hypothetical protein